MKSWQKNRTLRSRLALRSRRLVEWGCWLLAASFTLFYLLDPSDTSVWVQMLFTVGQMWGVGLLLLGVGLGSERKLRWTLIYPLAILLYLLIPAYLILDEIFDYLVQTKVVVYPCLAIFWLCTSLQFYRRPSTSL